MKPASIKRITEETTEEENAMYFRKLESGEETVTD